MIYVKITRGFVAQHFDTETGDCIQQEFVADPNFPAEWQDPEGNAIPDADVTEFANMEKECSMDMVQP